MKYYIIEKGTYLKEHGFEVEKLDRKIQAEEPRFFEIKDKLSRLEAKRDKIKQFLSKNENI